MKNLVLRRHEVSIDCLKDEYRNKIIDIIYQNYVQEFRELGEERKEFEVVKQYIEEAWKEMDGIVFVEDTVKGFLLYTAYQDEQGVFYCYIPAWGYGAVTDERIAIMSRLFTYLAEKMVNDTKVHFEVSIYAHDEDMIHLFSMLQFGIQAETGIRKVAERNWTESNGVIVRELPKEELCNRWPEVWKLVSGIIQHLQKSPIFYPGEEFTEEVYKEFFADEDTRVCIAEKDGQYIGVIEANASGKNFIVTEKEGYNVGEAYVLPEYRGSEVAHKLLEYTEQMTLQHNLKYQWVEHGTANPNARGFWNKYFTTHVYTLIRDIEPVSR